MATLDKNNTAQKKHLKTLADEVSKFWHGAHLYLNIIHEDTAPSMNWRTVNFPVKDLSQPEFVKLSTLYHEWGHRTISPESPEIAKIWQLLVLQTLENESIFSSLDDIQTEVHHIIVNMITDLWVDNYYINNPHTGDFYLKATKHNIETAKKRIRETYKEKKKEIDEDEPGSYEFKDAYNLFRLFIDLYESIIQKKSNSNHLFKNNISEKAYDILFKRKIKRDTAIVEFTKLVQYLIPFQASYVKLFMINGILKSNKNQVYPVDKNKMIRLMKKYGIRGGSSHLRAVFGIKKGTEIFIHIKEMQLYTKVIDTVESVHRKEEKKHQYMGFKKWRVGHRLADLQIMRGVERYGRIIPNFNTIQKNYMKLGKSNNNSGMANICLIADDSGSMSWGNTLDNLQEAMFSIVLAAEKRMDSVSIVIFGSDVSYDQKPTNDYTKLKKVVASLEGRSGDTILLPALKRATKFAEQVQKQTTFIFTDTYIFESEEDLRPQISRLASISKIVIFAFSVSEKDAKDFWKYFSSMPNIIIYYIKEDTHFYESSLKEIYNE